MHWLDPVRVVTAVVVVWVELAFSEQQQQQQVGGLGASVQSGYAK